MTKINIEKSFVNSLICSKANGGYTLPLVLFAVAGVTILIATSYRISVTRNLVGRNLVNAEIVDDTAESFFEMYSGLLNSNTKQPLNYFWLSQSCSPSLATSDCPPDYINSRNNRASGIKLPTSTFFQDTGEKWEAYCHAFTPSGGDTLSRNCFGRSAAPVCSVESKNASSFTIPWQQYKQTIDRFSRSFQLYPGLTAFNQRSAPYSLIYKKTQIGSPELGGESWIDLKSFAIDKDTSRLRSSKSFRLRYSIDKFIDSSKFAYLSAGSYHSSASPYSLTNLAVSSDGRYPVRGVILLRKNLPTNYRCGSRRINELFNIQDSTLRSSLPRRGDGGLAVHAVKFPNVPDSSTSNPSINNLNRVVIRGTKVYPTIRQERIFKYENLFLTRDSTLVFETSSQYPVTVVVQDSLDVAPGARICNVEIGRSLQSCGSGNPVNLIIKGNPVVWRKQPVDSRYRFIDSPIQPDPARNRFYNFSDNEAFCSAGRGGFGELIAANNNSSLISPRPKSQKPGPSFSFSSTGGRSDSLSAFIVGKYVSFNAPAVSALPPLIQAPFFEDGFGNQTFNSSSFVATHRGRLAAVNIQPYKNINNSLVKSCSTNNCIYTLLSPPENRYSPFKRITLNNIDPHRTSTPYYNVSPDTSTLDSTFILAVASSITSNSGNSTSSSPNIWVSYNWKTNQYKIRPFKVSNEVYNRNWLGRSEDASYILLEQSPEPTISYQSKSLPTTFTSSDPNFSKILSFLEDYYKIKLTAPSVSPYISDRLSNKASLTPSRYRRYKGAIWTKNICFSINRRLNRESGHTMTFPASFAKDLSDRFIAKYPNHDLDYGMRSYKYTYMHNWDATKGF